MRCENCGRSWSDPAPETCPRCDSALTKQEDGPAEDKMVDAPPRDKRLRLRRGK